MHVLELISKQLRCLFGRDVTKVWLGHQFLSIFELRQTLRFKNPRHATKTRSRRVWCEICLGSGWDFHLVKIPLVLGSEVFHGGISHGMDRQERVRNGCFFVCAVERVAK